MPCKFFSAATTGLEADIIEVEVDLLSGMPAFTIVGLGDTAVQEAKERIRSAIRNSKFEYPQNKKIINLAPAHLPKKGPQFDLSMALGIIMASKQICRESVSEERIRKTIFLGELALDGKLRPINGAISMAMAAKKNGFSNIVTSPENFQEAACVEGLTVVPLEDLQSVVRWCETGSEIEHSGQKFLIESEERAEERNVDFSDIIGQETAKRAVTIAAAGGHHILLFGSPGIGKTLLARALPTIQPPLTKNEQLEVTRVYSCAGLMNRSKGLITKRPFREIHQSSTTISILGGGNRIVPGEISLAHNGVLFVDEIGEFPRTTLESLRQPLEERIIHLSRNHGSSIFPANFTMVASMNPCPCGYYGDKKKNCSCRPSQILHYQKKLSGPLLDRLDITVHLERPIPGQNGKNETSAQIQQKVIIARKKQQDRFSKLTINTNSEMNVKEINDYAQLKSSCHNLLSIASEKLQLSMRQQHQVIKVARTIADLNDREYIEEPHIAEALQYRQNVRIA